uniref:Cysteine sulfinic acid decarboxylase n=1 Tax=Naja naja TaxID=35670 RepID=A0A8C6XVF5_NAJNA
MAAEDSLSSPGLDRVAGEKFLQEAFQIMLEEGIRKGMDASEKVCIWKEPEELQRILDLNLKDSGEPHERLLERCRDVIRYSVKTCHPRFCNQLFSGLDPHALAGRMITEMLNTSQYTYEIAPVFVLMEEVVLKKLQKLVGWEKESGYFQGLVFFYKFFRGDICLTKLCLQSLLEKQNKGTIFSQRIRATTAPGELVP